jgi:thiamine-monophosphate kinase
LCLTAPVDARDAVLRAAASAGVPVSCIGRIVDVPGVVACSSDGDAWSAPAAGWVHFA